MLDSFSRPMALLFLAFSAITRSNAQNNVATAEQFMAARQRKDEATLLKLVTPDMRIWYEEKKGEGRLWSPKSAWANWDDFFRGTKNVGTFHQDSNVVTVTVTETNDFFALIERPPSQVQLSWWFNPSGKIEGYLVKSLSGNSVPDRLDEFSQWASQTDAAELAYLMPGGNISPEGDRPEGDRPERWKKMLLRWRDTLQSPKKTQAQNCLERIIAADDSLGKARNHACERIDLSETIRQYVAGLEKLDYAGCPEAFADAFRQHCKAWLDLIPMTDRYPHLRGEMHVLFKQIETGSDGEAFKTGVKKVWDTWSLVEAAMK